MFSHQRSNGLWHAFLGSLATLGAKSATLAVTNVLSLRGPLSPPQATPSGSDAIVELRLQKVRRARAAKFFRLWPSFVHKIPLQRAVSGFKPRARHSFSVLRPSQLLAYPHLWASRVSRQYSSFLWAQRDPDSLTSRERGHKLKSMRRCLCHLSMRLYFNQLMAAAVAEHPFTVPLRIMVFFAPSRPPSPPSRAAYPVDCREYEGVGQQRTRRR